ncbi:hypothetical protein FBUS_00658 [Fasciolopsis buskii]|uniref:Uncharacterized protein n=1 Tax=Fasciolopsis buskii TaxID=27845 RepID=A0A8E0RRG9_9TREM|nr:hypothetical protein FBUS_00658 [Fasciolopsis buski]
MILLYYAVSRWICLIPWVILLLLLDEVVRQTQGWPLHFPTHQQSILSPPEMATNKNNPGTINSPVPTILWPFSINSSDNGRMTLLNETTDTTTALTHTLSKASQFSNDTEEDQPLRGDSFVEDHAGVWVIGVMSGTCILTIAFIVRALFSRAEAFRDPQENMFAQDGMDEHMGLGIGGANGGPSGSDFGHI